MEITKLKNNPTISLCMIVKNEEKFLPTCLDSVKDYVDEIIIVDTGSTDRTVEIAKKYNARTYFHPWENSFSKARNYSLNYAVCDWIIWLDADEEISREDAYKLKEVIDDNNVNVIYLPLFSKFDNGEGLAVANSAKIFRNHLGFHFEGIVHNTLKFSGPVKKVNIKAYHHGYNQDKKQMDKKFSRTSTLLKEQIKSNPENPLPHHYLATSYLERRMYDECILEALQAIELYERHNKSSRFLLLTYYTIGVAYRYKNDLKNAEVYPLKALKLCPEYIDHYDLLSLIYFMQKNYSKFEFYTRKYFERLKAIEKDPSIVLEVPYNTLNNAWLAYSRMAICYFQQGMDEKGTQALNDSVNCANNVWGPYLAIGKYFMEENNFKLAEKFLKEGLEKNKKNKSILYYLVEMYEKSGDLDNTIIYIKDILKSYPDEISTQYQLGLLLSKNNRFEEAIHSFKSVVSIDPKHIDALFNLAVAYENTGNVAQAKNTYNNILTINPEHPETLVRLGSLYLNESDYINAEKYFKNTRKLGKYLLESNLALSKIYVYSNDIESCIMCCDELLKDLDLPRNIKIDGISDLSNLYIKIGTSLMEQKNETLSNFSLEIASLLGPTMLNEKPRNH